MSEKPMLNLGCGRIILPADKPDHHVLVESDIYSYPEWVNIDKNMVQGVDKVVDLFKYPWDLPSDSFSGALLAHVCEHIPHGISFSRSPDEINYPEDYSPNSDVTTKYGQHLDSVASKYARQLERFEILKRMQDGWFAFFSELWRVLEHGAVVHIISPYGFSNGGLIDPSHTRYLTEHSFSHSMSPNPDAPFEYDRQLHFRQIEETPMRPTEYFAGEPYFVNGQDTPAFWRAKQIHINVVSEFYVRLVAVKE